MSITSVL